MTVNQSINQSINQSTNLRLLYNFFLIIHVYFQDNPRGVTVADGREFSLHKAVLRLV